MSHMIKFRSIMLVSWCCLILLVARSPHFTSADALDTGTLPPNAYYFPLMNTASPRQSAYTALKLVFDGSDYEYVKVGSTIDVPVELENRGAEPITLPLPDCSAGIVELWIERLGADVTIPDWGEPEDGRYLLGEQPVLLPDCSLPIDQSVTLTWTVDTVGMPGGVYAWYAEYVKDPEDGGGVVKIEVNYSEFQAQLPEWEEQDSGVDLSLRAMSFVDADTGWVVGVDATVLGTTDGGVTWSKQHGDMPDIVLWDVDFVDEKIGWALGVDVGKSQPVLWKTDSGGLDWQPLTPPPAVGLAKVQFLDALNGHLLASGSEHFDLRSWYTHDGGNTWQGGAAIHDGSFAEPYAMEFVDMQTGWIATWGGQTGIVATVDGGETWSNQPTGDITYTTGVTFVGPTTGWCVGYDGMPDYRTTVFQTATGGNVWTPVSNFNGYSKAISFADMDHGFLVTSMAPSSSDLVSISHDGAQTWPDQYVVHSQVEDAVMVSATRGFVVTNDGKIYRHDHQ